MSHGGNVLVGMDFSASARSALREGVRIASRRGVELHVVHVIDGAVLEELAEATGLSREEIEKDAILAGEEKIRDEVSQAGPGGKGAKAVAIVGEPLKELLRHGKKVGAGLYIAGERGSGTMGSGVGGVALGLARKAEGCVLVVEEGHFGPFARVAALVDFSETSREALREAARIAKGDGAELWVVHAFAPPWEVVHYRAPTPEAKPDYQAEYRRTLKSRLEALAKEACGEYGGEARVHLVESGSIAGGIVKDLREHEVGLAVVGTRGRSTLRALLLGSVAERILREAHCAVMAVKPSGFRFDVD
ncbi:MAG: universal stress protein [Phycisphaerales bacterium]